MGTRLELQAKLEAVLGSDAVYFQPPPSIRMVYPCIVYELARISTSFADNNSYGLERQYQLTIITNNPDSDLPMQVAGLSRCRHDRHFVTENLNHDIFSMYY